MPISSSRVPALVHSVPVPITAIPEVSSTFLHVSSNPSILGTARAPFTNTAGLLQRLVHPTTRASVPQTPLVASLVVLLAAATPLALEVQVRGPLHRDTPKHTPSRHSRIHHFAQADADLDQALVPTRRRIARRRPSDRPQPPVAAVCLAGPRPRPETLVPLADSGAMPVRVPLPLARPTPVAASLEVPPSRPSAAAPAPAPPPAQVSLVATPPARALEAAAPP